MNKAAHACAPLQVATFVLISENRLFSTYFCSGGNISEYEVKENNSTQPSLSPPVHSVSVLALLFDWHSFPIFC